MGGMMPLVRNSLRVNELLHHGERLTSHNGMFYAAMQTDGNFVVYSSNNQALWASNSNHAGNSHVVV